MCFVIHVRKKRVSAFVVYFAKKTHNYFNMTKLNVNIITACTKICVEDSNMIKQKEDKINKYKINIKYNDFDV